MPGPVCRCRPYLVGWGLVQHYLCHSWPAHGFVHRNAFSRSPPPAAREIDTSATLENPLSSCRHLASFAACNPRELVFFCITLRPLAGVCSLGRSVMTEVFDPGYRIRVGGLPAGWSELGRKAPELSRDDYLGKLHADMDIARTMHYACGSYFNYEASSIARGLFTVRRASTNA